MVECVVLLGLVALSMSVFILGVVRDWNWESLNLVSRYPWYTKESTTYNHSCQRFLVWPMPPTAYDTIDDT